jgi:hypothetical protein
MKTQKETRDFNDIAKSPKFLTCIILKVINTSCQSSFQKQESVNQDPTAEVIENKGLQIQLFVMGTTNMYYSLNLIKLSKLKIKKKKKNWGPEILEYLIVASNNPAIQGANQLLTTYFLP